MRAFLVENRRSPFFFYEMVENSSSTGCVALEAQLQVFKMEVGGLKIRFFVVSLHPAKQVAEIFLTALF